MDDSLTAPLRAEMARSIARARAYLLSRQSAEGGFCFYRTAGLEEANLRDTYHALFALGLLGVPVPQRERLIAFLQEARIFGLGYVYWYAFALDLLGLAEQIEPARLEGIRRLAFDPPPAEGGVGRRAWLTDSRRKARLKRRFAGRCASPALVRCLRAGRRDGGYGETPNLWDTLASLIILDCLGCRREIEASAAFVERLQVLPFGFALAAETHMPSLEVVHAGVRCCALLGLPIRHKAAVVELALACQTADGGFSRTPTALPDIDLTHQALRVFAQAAAPPAQRGEAGRLGEALFLAG